MEGEQKTTTEHSHNTTMEPSIKEAQFVALCTIPVVVKKGNRQLVINAMLDDGSTKSYIQPL